MNNANNNVRPRVGQRRVSPVGTVVVLLERQNRPNEGPMYVIGIADETVDGGFRRLETRSRSTVETWPIARTCASHRGER